MIRYPSANSFPTTGILAWCCPCIVYAQNKQRYEHLALKGTPDPERGGSGCNGDCFVHGCITACFGVGWVLQVRRCNVSRLDSSIMLAADRKPRQYPQQVLYQRRRLWRLLDLLLLHSLRTYSRKQRVGAGRSFHQSISNPWLSFSPSNAGQYLFCSLVAIVRVLLANLYA